MQFPPTALFAKFTSRLLKTKAKILELPENNLEMSSASNVDREKLLNFALGACVGACIGDASGAPLEKIGRRTPTVSEVLAASRFELPCALFEAGQVTDDGELTVSLARGLARLCDDAAESQRAVELTPDSAGLERIAEEYAFWAQSSPSDMGITVGSSIGVAASKNSLLRERAKEVGWARVMNDGAVFEAQCAPPSQSNGQLMRVTPLAAFAAAHIFSRAELDPPAKCRAVFDACRADGSLSHIHCAVTCSSAAYVYLLATMLCDESADLGVRAAAGIAGLREFAASPVPCSCVVEWISAALAISTPEQLIQMFKPGGWSRVGLTLTVFAVQHLHDKPFTDVIQFVISLGGDTDTNACIVGGALGALAGFASLPVDSKRAVLSCEPKSRPEKLRACTLLESVAKIVK